MRRPFCLLLVSVVLAMPVHSQVKEIAPPAGVIREGIPPIPASIEVESYAYRSVSGFFLIGWDPEKPQMMISGWAPGYKFASRVENPGQTPIMILKLPDWDRDMRFSPDGNYLVYVKPADENFQDQIYRYDIKTKETTLLTDGKSRNRYPIFSNSGKMLAYSSNRRDGKNMDVYVMDPLDPKSVRVLATLEGEDWALFDWSPDDSRVLLSDWRSPNESYLWLLDIKSGRRTPLTPAQENEKVFNGSSAFFSNDGKGMYFVTDRGSEFRRLVYLDFYTRHSRFLADRINWDIDELALSPDRKTLAFISNEDGIGRLRLLDTATSKELPAPEMPTGVVSNLIWHKQLPYLGFSFSSTKSPSDVSSLNLKTGKIERWTTTRTSARNDQFREPELIKWKSFDNRTISGFLYRPPQNFVGKRPVIVNIHGGPPEQYRPIYLGEANYYVQSLGIAMVYPNVRGSTGYGKTFMKLDDGQLRGNVAKDIGALLDWIAKDPGLDSDRVLIQGGSYGGYVALSVAEAYPARICALMTYLAPTNLVTFVERNSANDQDGWRHEIGDERNPATRMFLDKIAPVNGADKIGVPSLLAIGGKDLMTSPQETSRIAEVLKEKGLPVWYLVAQKEGHNFRDPWVYQYKFCVEALFVKQYLIGKEK